MFALRASLIYRMTPFFYLEVRKERKTRGEKKPDRAALKKPATRGGTICRRKSDSSDLNDVNEIVGKMILQAGTR
jgi:hypothetical protein